MKLVIMVAMAIGTVMMVTSCGPKLKTSKYGPVEKEWTKYVKQSYPSWKPPQTLPPAVVNDKNPELETLGIPSPVNKKNEQIVLKTDEVVVEEPVIEEPIIEAPVIEEKKSAEEVAPVIEPAEPVQPIEKIELYTVQKGDTLSGIAKKYYGKAKLWPRIADSNNISDPRKIRVGMQLKIPVEK